jgi:acetylornithine deacetylase/succinyl-diaminopimelate desuccinylase-like protein
MVIKGRAFETSFNIDGIWGGNMYAGGAGAIMPNKITSKHNFRYVPRMNGLDIVKKLRAQLDKNGYKDVEMKLIGDVPWSRGSSRDTDITHAGEKATEHMAAVGLGGTPPSAQPLPQPSTAPRTSAANRKSNALFLDEEPEPTGGYWPSYLWTDGEVGEKVGTIRIPMGMGGPGGGGGGRGHAANEFYIVEGINKTSGMATYEKGVAATIYEYAKTTTTPPKPKKR